MDRPRYKHPLVPQLRPKLNDITSQVNNQRLSPIPHRLLRKNISPQRLPHHESLLPAGDLHYNTPVYPPMVENKRLSAVTDTTRASKRYSQSSASTNASVELTGRKRKSRVGPWLLGATLGQGATCRVRKAKHVITGLEAAVKIVSRYVAQDQRSESVVAMDTKLSADPRWHSERRVPFNIEREILIMKLIEHPHVTRLYDVWENRGEIYLVLEYVEKGELFSYIMDEGRLPEAEAVRIFRQIVSGLEHCHFFKLCHRDLKPENILLDSLQNVKIADFGMAAVQHSHWLSTSCGSPHYAAPEVVRGLKYDGEKADIWSVGVVLYVMLVGRHPFGADCDINDPNTRDQQLRKILTQVINAEVVLPEWISDEAEDLVLRLLEPDPVRRIPIFEIWQHPLLLKYQGIAKRNGWLGDPHLTLSKQDCGGALHPSQIDMDVVSNICMLWQTTSEDAILRKLKGREPNYERLLYHRLLASRQEQEENFHGVGIEVSSSDYHHVGKRRQLRRSTTRVSSQPFSIKASRSQYSIANSNARKPSSRSARTCSEAETDRSYDPFRASRNPLTPAGAYAKVTLLRESSNEHVGHGSENVGLPPQHPALLRVRDETISCTNSSPPVSWPRDANGNLRTLRHTAPPARCQTTSSFSSSAKSCRSSRFKRSSNSYKRRVVFPQTRRRSESSRVLPSELDGPSVSSMPYRYEGEYSHLPSKSATTNLRVVNTDPTEDGRSSGNSLALRKKRAVPDTETNRFSAYLKEEARQVSRELGKFCDDAFRDSATNLATSSPSAVPTSNYPKRPLFRAIPPPRKSSINQSGRQSIPLHANLYRDRPLPDTPVEDTITLQKLKKFIEIRNTIMRNAQYLPSGAMNDALRTIEDLIQRTEAEHQSEQSNRIFSDPAPNCLSTKPTSLIGGEGGPRHVSEPTPSRGWNTLDSTSRYVGGPPGSGRAFPDQSQLPNGFPLQINPPAPSKQSNTFDGTVHRRQMTIQEQQRGRQNFWGNNASGILEVEREAPLRCIYEDEKEAPDNARSALPSREAKFKSWFRRSGSSAKAEENEQPPTPPAKDDRHSHSQDFDPEERRFTGVKSLALLDHGETDVSQRKDRRIFGFLGRKDASKDNNFMSVADTDDEDSLAQSSATSRGEPRANAYPQSKRASAGDMKSQHVKFENEQNIRLGGAPAQNWIARFLKVKPAKRTITLQVNKNVALKEVRGILRDWKGHGMRDVVTDRASGKLWARVDIENSLRIKPVAIRIEFFTVLLRGRKNNLSVARFVQESGAKSSFGKVAKTMEGVLRGRGMLVSEGSKARKMRQCLKEWDRLQ